MVKIIKYIAVLLVIVLGVAAAYIYFSSRSEQNIVVRAGEVTGVETMVQLSTIDIYSEVPVLDTINGKVMFAIQKQRGSISFDLEKMQVDATGDTVRIVLSPEIIELYESTDNNSWEVIDTKAIGPLAVLRSDKLTNAEENTIKLRIKRKSKRQLYKNGTVARARKEAAENLEDAMAKIYRKPVIVTDPTPKGAYYGK